MRYLLLLTNTTERIASWETMSEEEKGRARRDEMPRWNPFFERMRGEDRSIDGLELDVPRRARTVRLVDGEAIVTDGPYAETREQLGGYFLVECASLDEAIELASLVPVAETGSVEIRPLAE